MKTFFLAKQKGWNKAKGHISENIWEAILFQFLASYYLCSVKEENRDKNEKGSIQSSHENGSQYT